MSQQKWFLKLQFLKKRFKGLTRRILRFTQQCVSYPIARIRGNGVTTLWGFGNFGDLITPILLRELGYTPINTSAERCDLLLVGSILDCLPEDYAGVILGSGFLNEKNAKRLVRANILAVRGRLSRKLLGLAKDVPLGDGGLLLPRFLEPRSTNKYAIGIVPHYSDTCDPRLDTWLKNFGRKAILINVRQPTQLVFDQICSCECIVSSSLHGLVVADSVGIQNLWIRLSDLCGNGEFKFHDYYSAFPSTRTSYIPTGTESIDDLLQLCEAPHESVEQITDELYRLLCSLPSHLPRQPKKRL